MWIHIVYNTIINIFKFIFKEPHLIASPDRSEAKTTESKHMPHKHEENKEEYVDIEEQQKQPKKVESIHKITPASHDHEDSDKKGSNPEQSPWADELDGEAERPGGAVLSLTLGKKMRKLIEFINKINYKGIRVNQ